MRRKYTEAQKKQSKSFRNKIYYYGKKEDRMAKEMASKAESVLSIISDQRVATGEYISFCDIRSFIDNEDEARKLYYANVFDDDNLYYWSDFRDVLIMLGMRTLAEDICKRAGLPSLADYENDLMNELNQNEEYSLARERYAEAANAREEAVYEYQEWKKNVWNK